MHIPYPTSYRFEPNSSVMQMYYVVLEKLKERCGDLVWALEGDIDYYGGFFEDYDAAYEVFDQTYITKEEEKEMDDGTYRLALYAGDVGPNEWGEKEVFGKVLLGSKEFKVTTAKLVEWKYGKSTES